MTPLEERLLQLKSEVENLRITAEESKIKFDTAKELSSLNPKTETKSPKEIEDSIRLSRIYLEKELDYLRDKTTIIRKVSPRTADFLDTKINEYEKATNDYLKLHEKPESEDLSWLELGSKFVTVIDFLSAGSKLHDLVEMTCNCFLDTIDYLEGNKQVDIKRS